MCLACVCRISGGLCGFFGEEGLPTLINVSVVVAELDRREFVSWSNREIGDLAAGLSHLSLKTVSFSVIAS